LAVYRRSRRHRYALVLLVLTSVTVITLDFRDDGQGVLESVRSGARDAFSPVQSAVGKVFSPVGDFFGGITRYRAVKSENARLRRELETARGDAIRGADATRERQLLNALARLDFAGDLRGVTARVVSNSPSNFQLTVTVDRGTDAGLAAGMPVVTPAGLVGRISEVSKNRSTVLLLTDPASSVGVRLAGTGDIGVVTGSGRRDSLPLNLVSVETKVADGEAVVTSGLEGGLFPPQIPVGRVRGAKITPGQLEQEITIEPVVDLDRLELVRILIWQPTQSP
jgi:rod shape-determining protein MreC